MQSPLKYMWKIVNLKIVPKFAAVPVKSIVQLYARIAVIAIPSHASD